MDIVALVSDLVSGFIQADEDFYTNPDHFAEIEKDVVGLCIRTAAGFLSMMLSQMDQHICDNSERRKYYTKFRTDTRTLITTAGDVVFKHTLFTDKRDGSRRYLLDDLIKLPDRERFSEDAEEMVLRKAAATSYQQAADALQIGGQKISKTAVMKKVHGILKDLPEESISGEKKKVCEHLYIEADEDHISSQKDQKAKEGYLGKLIYLFEGKEDVCKGKRRLMSPHYSGGLYRGSHANGELWDGIQRYLEKHYDTESLKRVYICSDGGGWIKAGLERIAKSVPVTDKFHLAEYLKRAANCTLDERELTEGRLYEAIWEDDLPAARQELERIMEHCDGSDKAVTDCLSFLENNWEGIQRAYHDPNALGGSAEGHVSHLYSARMSSRPMGWSETGADRMCMLRCYIKNNGEEKVLDLVRYRRQKALQEQGKAAGAELDEIIEKVRDKAPHGKIYMETAKYFNTMQTSIMGNTAKKTMAIREHLRGI